MSRKIIQLAVDEKGYMNALCADGTCWVRKVDGKWREYLTYPPGSTPEDVPEDVSEDMEECVAALKRELKKDTEKLELTLAKA